MLNENWISVAVNQIYKINTTSRHLFWLIQGLPCQSIFEKLHQLLIDKYKQVYNGNVLLGYFYYFNKTI